MDADRELTALKYHEWPRNSALWWMRKLSRMQ